MSMKNVVLGVCTLVEVGCVAALAGIGLKRNNDCYKAECKLADAEIKLAFSEMDCGLKACRIKQLEDQIKDLQKGES